MVYIAHILYRSEKVAVILHNYPPKNSNIGSAAGLDTPESVLRLLRDMKAEGYTIDTVPETSADLMDVVTSHMTNDRSMLTDLETIYTEKRFKNLSMILNGTERAGGRYSYRYGYHYGGYYGSTKLGNGR